MAFQDFLFRARRPVSLIDFNAALPTNFKLIHRVAPADSEILEWVPRRGVNLNPIANLELVPGSGTLFNGIHYNLLVTNAWSGWDGLFITDPADPDFDDPRLDKSKLKRWFKNNGVERLDTAAEHPRSGRTDMRWFRWEDGPAIERLDITIDAPVFSRRKWAGET